MLIPNLSISVRFEVYDPLARLRRAASDAAIDAMSSACCHAVLARWQAALCSAQCACWHLGEQYSARWHPLHFCTASSRSEGPLKFWHLRRTGRTISLRG